MTTAASCSYSKVQSTHLGSWCHSGCSRSPLPEVQSVAVPRRTSISQNSFSLRVGRTPRAVDTPGTREDSGIHLKQGYNSAPRAQDPRSPLPLSPPQAVRGRAVSSGPALPSSAVGAAPCRAQPRSSATQNPPGARRAEQGLTGFPAPRCTASNPTLLSGDTGTRPDPHGSASTCPATRGCSRVTPARLPCTPGLGTQACPYG